MELLKLDIQKFSAGGSGDTDFTVAANITFNEDTNKVNAVGTVSFAAMDTFDIIFDIVSSTDTDTVLQTETYKCHNSIPDQDFTMTIDVKYEISVPIKVKVYTINSSGIITSNTVLSEAYVPLGSTIQSLPAPLQIDGNTTSEFGTFTLQPSITFTQYDGYWLNIAYSHISTDSTPADPFKLVFQFYDVTASKVTYAIKQEVTLISSEKKYTASLGMALADAALTVGHTYKVISRLVLGQNTIKNQRDYTSSTFVCPNYEPTRSDYLAADFNFEFKTLNIKYRLLDNLSQSSTTYDYHIVIKDYLSNQKIYESSSSITSLTLNTDLNLTKILSLDSTLSVNSPFIVEFYLSDSENILTQSNIVTSQAFAYKYNPSVGTLSDGSVFTLLNVSQTDHNLQLEVLRTSDATAFSAITFAQVAVYSDRVDYGDDMVYEVTSQITNLDTGTYSISVTIPDVLSGTYDVQAFFSTEDYQSVTVSKKVEFTTTLPQTSTLSTAVKSFNTVDDTLFDNTLITKPDLLGTSYVFKGPEANNWVKFGKNAKGQELYWRILRIDGDNSIRLLYSGVKPDTTAAYISTADYGGSDIVCVGYTYGMTASSTQMTGYEYGTTLADARQNTYNSGAKTIIDTWYQENILGTTYESAINQNAIFINDRSCTNWDSTQGIPVFAAAQRLIQNKPSLINGVCDTTNYANKSDLDLYTMSTADAGNKYLTYPIALPTADELMLTGKVYQESANSWIDLNSKGERITGIYSWFTLSPDAKSTGKGYEGYIVKANTFTSDLDNLNWSWTPEVDSPAYTFGILDSGPIYSGAYTVYHSIRPVLVLNSNVLYKSGTGTPEEPFIIEDPNAPDPFSGIAPTTISLTYNTDDPKPSSIYTVSYTNTSGTYTGKFKITLKYDNTTESTIVEGTDTYEFSLSDFFESTPATLVGKTITVSVAALIEIDGTESTSEPVTTTFTVASDGIIIGTASVTDITNTTAKITCPISTPVSLLGTTGFISLKDQQDNVIVIDFDVPSTDVGQITIDVADLIPNMKYICTVNLPVGEATYKSAEFEFTTIITVPEPLNLQFTYDTTKPLNASTFTATWTNPASTKGARYNVWVNSVKVAGGSAPGATTYRLPKEYFNSGQGLNPGQTIKVGVQCFIDDWNNERHYSDYIYTDTLTIQQLDPPVINSVQLFKVTKNQITVITDVALPEGISELNGLTYSCDDGVTWSSKTTDTQHTFTGLNPNTEYKIKVRAYSTSTIYAESESLAITTINADLSEYRLRIIN